MGIELARQVIGLTTGETTNSETITSVIRPLPVTLAVVLALSTASPSRAERPPLKRYTAADGLTHDSVNKIVRDSHGFLWLCTAEGLSRFDGTRFKSYTQNDGLPHRNVNDLLETRSGEYLVATSAGLSVFNPTGRAYRWNVLASRLDQTSGDPPLFRTLRPAPGASPSDNSINWVRTLVEDRAGRIWAGTANGLFRVERAGDAWAFRRVPIEHLTVGPSVVALMLDASGEVLMSSDAGVHRLSGDGSAQRLLSVSSGALYLDRENRLWVDSGLDLRVFAVDREGVVLLHTYTQRDGLPEYAAHFNVHQMSDGRIYVGFAFGFSEFLPDAA